MIDPPDSATLADPALAAQAALEAEKQKQTGSVAGDVADIAGNVMVDGVGEMIGAVVGTAVEGVGTVAGAAVDVVGAVIGGILEGI